LCTYSDLPDALTLSILACYRLLPQVHPSAVYLYESYS
jgi:hypothetical protein